LRTVNDLESKLRSLNFRQPPPGLRGVTLAAARAPGWKNWLAPHPAAWAALAALWVVLAVLNGLLDRPEAASHAGQVARSESPEAPALLAFYQRAGLVEPAL
jgi:hypothetical protein